MGSAVGLGFGSGTAGQTGLRLVGGVSWIGPCSMVEANDSWAARVKAGGGISWIGQCSLVWSRDSWFGAAGVKAGGVGCNLRRGHMTRGRGKRSITPSYLISPRSGWSLSSPN